MRDRCYSTLVCAEQDKDIFEKMATDSNSQRQCQRTEMRSEAPS